MSKLISLIIVYVVHRHLKNYGLFQKLQQHCHVNWLDDCLFKTQMLANNYSNIPVAAAATIFISLIFFIILLLDYVIYFALKDIGLTIFYTIILTYCLCSSTKKSYSSIFVNNFEYSFSLLFWFSILGSIGLIFYWLFMLGGTKKEQINGVSYAKSINNILFDLHNIAAWLPSRITGLIFSLVGDFEQGFNKWQSSIKILNMPNYELIDACGEAALGNSTMEQAPVLVERTLIAWFIICILITLII